MSLISNKYWHLSWDAVVIRTSWTLMTSHCYSMVWSTLSSYDLLIWLPNSSYDLTCPVGINNLVHYPRTMGQCTKVNELVKVDASNFIFLEDNINFLLKVQFSNQMIFKINTVEQKIFLLLYQKAHGLELPHLALSISTIVQKNTKLIRICLIQRLTI